MMRFDALALQILQKKELLFCEICDPGAQGPWSPYNALGKKIVKNL